MGDEATLRGSDKDDVKISAILGFLRKFIAAEFKAGKYKAENEEE